MPATKMYILTDASEVEPKEKDYTISDGGGLYCLFASMAKGVVLRYASPLTGKEGNKVSDATMSPSTSA